jgi:anaerobic magnesium-protoporphyrin IX monomethyl ester cyclase
MKIHFVYLDSFSTYPPHYSVGLGSIIAVLKKNGHETILSYIRNNHDADIFLHEVRNSHPPVIAFSSMSSMYPWAKKLMPFIKQASPDTFTVCGGMHPTLEPKCIEETVGLDAICRGEGEYALLELITARASNSEFTNINNFYFKIKDEIIKNPIRPLIENLDELPIPDRETFDYEKICDPKNTKLRFGIDNKRLGEFLFTRGCPYDCSFCSNRALKTLNNGKYVRFRSVSKAIEELKNTVERYHLDLILLHDDTITLNKKWFNEFFTKYMESIKLPFICNSRVDTCNNEMLQLLKDAGCLLLVFGVESGNDYIRNSVLKKKISREQIIESFALAHKFGLQTYSQNMVGIPGETHRHFIDTINLNAELEPNIPGIGIFHPYPGTELGDMCRAKGLIVKETINFNERTDTILKLPGFKSEHIKYYNENFVSLVKQQARVNGKGWLTLEKYIPPYPAFRKLIKYFEKIHNATQLLFHKNNH